MTKAPVAPVVLVILDGWGYREEPDGNAIAAANGIDGTPLDVRYRTFDNGFRDTTDTSEHWQGIFGVKGSWMNWDWDGSLFYAEGTTTEHLNGGFQDYRLLLPLLNNTVSITKQ